MVEKENNYLAVIFNRIPSGYELVEEFVPVRVVEGAYYENEGVFVDTKQNVYTHMAGMSEAGNVYAGRTNIAEVMTKYKKLPLTEIKQKLLHHLQKYRFYKSVDESSEEYQIIKVKDKKTGEFSLFSDMETEAYYTFYDTMSEITFTMDETPQPVERKSKKISENSKLTLTPNEIIEQVKKTVKGQDEAIEKIVTLLWIRYNFPELTKTNMLIIGPSGVGKTAIFNKLKKILDIPLSIYSVPGTSQSGYKGHDIEEALTQLFIDSGRDIDKAEHGIIMIDEFDKLANNRDAGDIGTIAVQNELLKLVEGCERIIDIGANQSFKIDTSNIIFVCCGAFTNLYTIKKDKVVGFDTKPESKETIGKITTERIINDGGIAKELAGRLPVLIELNDLNDNRTILKDILLNSDESQLRNIIKVLENYGVTIENFDETIDFMVENCIKQKIGARGLLSSVMNTFMKIFKAIGDNPGKYEKIVIGPNIATDNTDFELIPKNVKKRVKKEEEV